MTDTKFLHRVNVNWSIDLKHLPFVLLLFLVLLLGATDLAIGVDTRVLATLLAPILWLGLYWLGSDRAAQGSR